MTKAALAVVAIDMPLAKATIVSRRNADRAISRAFGARGCSAHSPSTSRPGPLGKSLAAQLLAQGLPLVTATYPFPSLPCTIEVYPHPALLMLLKRGYRVPYKVSRAARYWPGTSAGTRVERLLAEFNQINSALGSVLGPPPLTLPSASQVRYLSHLKRYEDALDALVCAWVGICFIHGSVTAFGDEAASIWVPTESAT
jgi:predicted RNase H-like nuclease